MENSECSIAIDQKSVSLRSWFITTLCFQLLQTLWVTFLAKNSVRSTPAITALTPKFGTEAVTHVSQIVTYAVREKEMEHKGEQR